MAVTPSSSPEKSSTTFDSMPKHVLIVAGDPSGDQHGAELARVLKQRDTGIRVSALGGTHLKSAADQFLYPLVGLGGFGFWEPLLKLPKLWRARQAIKRLLEKDPPQVVIPIDYYGFNIHVARLAKQHGIPVVYFVSPQVWASRPGRVQKLAKVLTKILVIFPFEEELYRQAGIPVRFVGHPLLDRVPEPESANGTLTIGLLPGSRRGVVERHLPVLIEAADRLRSVFPQAQFLLFRPAELSADFYQPYLNGRTWLQVVDDPDYARRKKLSLAISVSGTAALENTLLGIPMIIMYKLSALTFAIARKLIRVPFVAIPNILAGKAVVPELLQADATPDKLASAARAVLENPIAARRMRDDLLAQRTRLGSKGAVQRAADEITHFL
jgi:lipid-A-disaccharide synthase